MTDMICGLTRQIFIKSDDYHGSLCAAIQGYLKFSFNWHVAVLLFYLVFFHKGLTDPLGSKARKEAMAFAVCLLLSILIAVTDPNKFNCDKD